MEPSHDQVPRKIRYESLHADVTFTPPCVHDPRWTARFGSGNFEMKAIELGKLLDRLEALDALPGTGKADAGEVLRGAAADADTELRGLTEEDGDPNSPG